MDAEWKPCSHQDKHGSPPVELIQLALPSRCWLLDLQRLIDIEAEATAAFLKRLCCGGEVTVAGWGLADDVKRIASSWTPHLKLSIVHELDLRKHDQSLRTKVRSALGGDIDKTHQCSDWSLRPFSLEQKHYAALDAHILLQLLAVGDA